MRPGDSIRRARAYAPGHVSGIFAPRTQARDPRRRGSVGAGIVLELGARAEAEWDPDRRGVGITDGSGRSLPISAEVARRLVGDRSGRLSVRIEHQLPVGQGFGMSASGGLATALATASVLGIPRRRAVEVAHLADYFGGGGLGGVASILGGGWEVRERPGIPPFGRVRHRGFPLSVFVGVSGRPIPSPRLLTDPGFLRDVERCATPGLARLTEHPSPELLLEEAERFTDALGLASPALAKLVRRLRGPGVRVAQAMFGESFYAVPLSTRGRRRLVDALARWGGPSVELHAARGGATVSRHS